MTEPKSRLEQALDLFVYAPVGMALTAAEELPKLIEKGRTRVTGQVTMARMMGQFAVQQGQRQAEKLVRDASERLTDLGVVPGATSRTPSNTPPTPSPPTPKPAPAAEAASGGAPAHHDRPADETKTKTDASSNGHRPAPPSDDLAIPGYDSLSASQVVQRLAGLAVDELEAVRTYESATRGRKTILSRIAQLQTGAA